MDAITGRPAENGSATAATIEQTVLGPCHVAAPGQPLGADISLTGAGRPCRVTGSVRNLDGTRPAWSLPDRRRRRRPVPHRRSA